MAKSSLPSVDGPVVALRQMDEAYLKIKQTEAVETVPTEGYTSKSVDVKMNARQASKFKGILRHLEDSGLKLKDGAFVNNKRRAVLYMIENFEIPAR